MLKKRLPPLDPLIAFEAAARLLSFTRASEELHLTQAAISQQIRNLEQNLQVKLFIRSHRAVQLTNEGREYQHTVTAILKQLAGATTDIKNVEISQQLIIGCDQTFATYWLIPKLQQLRQLLPHTSIRVVASDDDDECLARDIQLSILHGDGKWPGYHAIRLFDEEVFPVCSPAYDHESAKLNWVDWLLQAELIDLEDNHWNWMNWRLWLGGKDIDEPLRHRNLQINSYPLVIEAACQGLGVALGWQHLVNDLLDQGRLLRPFEESIKTEFGYYLLYRDSLHQEKNQKRFRDWLLQLFNINAAES